jgi:hypothetical protein
MYAKFVIFIVIASVLTMALYSSSINFVSAARECFGLGTSLTTIFCVSTGKYSNGEEYTIVTECSEDENGHWNCETVNKVNVPPGIDQSIDNAIKEYTQSNRIPGKLEIPNLNTPSNSTLQK